MKPHLLGGWLGGALAAAILGCGVPPEPTVLHVDRLKITEPDAEQGLLWMFPGMVGPQWEMGPAFRGLRDAGLIRQVEFFQWDQPGIQIFDHLTEYERNRELAAEVAARIVTYRDAYPTQPIDLIGYSAGAALAVWVAEALPADVRLNNVVLAQPGLSPTYDLTAALENIDGKLIVFYSPTDWVLAAGFTRVFGTLDRRFVVSAGKDGFILDAAVPDPELRAKVQQVGWNEEWAAVGHPGNHMAILQYRWNRYIVAPYLLEETTVADELQAAFDAFLVELWGGR